MQDRYVISIKRIKNYLGNSLSPDEQYFEYAGYDKWSGSMSTGYPVFLDEGHAHTFRTVEDAKNWWVLNNKDMLSNRYNYDYNTLAIRKVLYEEVSRL